MKKSKLKRLKIEPNYVTNYSIFPDLTGTQIKGVIHTVPSGDLAIGRL
jgi:hypothetical protein